MLLQGCVREALRRLDLRLVNPATPVDTVQKKRDFECLCSMVDYVRLEASCRILPDFFRALLVDSLMVIDCPLGDSMLLCYLGTTATTRGTFSGWWEMDRGAVQIVLRVC